jgi:heat shock protein HslJ
VDEQLEALLAQTRNRRWPWFIAGGVAAAAAAGAVVWWQLQKRSNVVPTSGTFVSSEVDGRDLVEGTQLRFTFVDDQMHVYAGGNNMGGSLSIIGSKLYWSEDASTAVGCLPNLAVQDTWLSSWLNAGVDVFRDHRRLVLAGQGVRVVMEPVRDER